MEDYITPKQLNFAEILLDDLGLEGARRIAHVNDILGGTKYVSLSQLTKVEGIKIIGTLIKWKEDKKKPKQEFDDRDLYEDS
jgi:hypothetical protein